MRFEGAFSQENLGNQPRFSPRVVAAIFEYKSGNASARQVSRRHKIGERTLCKALRKLDIEVAPVGNPATGSRAEMERAVSMFKDGKSMQEIAVATNRARSTISTWLETYEARLPAKIKATKAERTKAVRWYVGGQSVQSIATKLRRDRSTVRAWMIKAGVYKPSRSKRGGGL